MYALFLNSVASFVQRNDISKNYDKTWPPYKGIFHLKHSMGRKKISVEV